MYELCYGRAAIDPRSYAVLKVVSACEQIIVIHDGTERVAYLVGAKWKIMEGG